VLAGLDRKPGRDPRSQRTVQDAYVGQPGPAQQPPSACGREASGVVVDHHRPVGADAPASRRGLQRVEIRQRVPSLGGRRRCGQVVEVGEDRAGQVRLEVVRVLVRIAERPANVQNRRWLRSADPFGQFGRRDQYAHRGTTSSTVGA
jgi:hypothetical protein